MSGAAEAFLALIGKDQASAVISKVRGELGGLHTAGTVASTSLGRLEGVAGKVSGAMGHAAGQIGGLVSNLGLFAGVAGIGGVGAAVGTAVNKVESLYQSTLKLTTMTGESADTMSSLLAVTEKLGVEYGQFSQVVGFTEKTLGKLAETTQKGAAAGKSAALQALEAQKLELQAAGAKTTTINKLITEQKARDALAATHARALPPMTKLLALEKQYGVTLADAKGQALPFSEVLLNVADAYQKAASAADKAKMAALSAQVFGRGYAALTPLLSLGRTGIEDAVAEAKAMGATLTAANMVQLGQLRQVQLKWNDTLSGFEIQAGLTIIPMLTDIGNAANKFLGDPGNRKSLLGALTGIEGVAKTVAGAIVQVGSAIAGIWGKIPDPMKQLLVGGVVANKALGWLFGTSPLTMATHAGGNIVSTLLGGIFGKVPVVGGALQQATGTAGARVFVTNWPLGMGLPGGGGAAGDVAGGAAAAAGGIGLGTLATGAALTAGAVAAVGLTYLDVKGGLDKQSDKITGAIVGQTADQRTTNQQLAQSLLAVEGGQKDLNSNLATQFGGLLFGTNSNLDKNIADLKAALTARGVKLDDRTLRDLASGTSPGSTAAGDSRHMNTIAHVLATYAKGGPMNANAVLPALEALNSVFKTSTGASATSVANAYRTETALMKEAYKQGNTALGDKIRDERDSLRTVLTQINGGIVGLPFQIAGAIVGDLAGYMNSTAFQSYRQGERDYGDHVTVTVKNKSPRENQISDTTYKRAGGGSHVTIS